MKKLTWTEYALMIIPAVLLVGVLTIFPPCDAHEDGSYMSCHWAGMAIAGIAGAMTVISLMRIRFRDPSMRQAFDITFIVLCMLLILIPGWLIRLCTLQTMRCQLSMRPTVRIFAATLMILSFGDFLALFRQNRKETEP